MRTGCIGCRGVCMCDCERCTEVRRYHGVSKDGEPLKNEAPTPAVPFSVDVFPQRGKILSAIINGVEYSAVGDHALVEHLRKKLEERGQVIVDQTNEVRVLREKLDEARRILTLSEQTVTMWRDAAEMSNAKVEAMRRVLR